MSSMEVHGVVIVCADPTNSIILDCAATGKSVVLIGCSEKLLIISSVIGV